MRPTARISERRVSSPTQKRRKTTPSSEKTWSTSVGSTKAEYGRADHHPREDLADDRRLSDPLEELVAELGREQDDEEVGEDVVDARGGGDGEGEDVDQRRLFAGPEPSTKSAISSPLRNVLSATLAKVNARLLTYALATFLIAIVAGHFAG